MFFNFFKKQAPSPPSLPIQSRGCRSPFPCRRRSDAEQSQAADDAGGEGRGFLSQSRWIFARVSCFDVASSGVSGTTMQILPSSMTHPGGAAVLGRDTAAAPVVGGFRRQGRPHGVCWMTVEEDLVDQPVMGARLPVKA